MQNHLTAVPLPDLHINPLTDYSEDRERSEEPWDDRNESMIKEWIKDIKDKAILHTKSGYLFKKRNVIWGLPSVIIPVVMSPTSLMVTGDNSDTAKAVMFLLTGLFSGVHSFFKFGEQSQKHFNQAGRFEELAVVMEVEMKKHRGFRMQADVFIAKTQQQIANLNDTAPIIPKSIIKSNH